MAQSENIIELRDVRRCFGKTAAVDGISLNVRQNEILGIIGRSGAGKSTLIRCLNGLERIDSGQIFFENQNVSDLHETQWHPVRRRMGMIFQHFNLLSSKSIIDNIALPLKIAGVKKAQRLKRAHELLELVGLTDKAKQYPAQLSGGQKQRVGIARALAAKPKILLSDEATSALDPETTHSILELLRDINRQLGLTIVLITHEMEVIRDIAQRVIVLNHGRIVEEGSVKDIIVSPKDKTTQSMLKTIIPHLPEDYAQKLSPNTGSEAIISIVVSGATAKTAFLEDLRVHSGLVGRLVHGGLENIQGETIGRLYIALPAGDNTKLQQAIDWLHGHCDYVRELGYV